LKLPRGRRDPLKVTFFEGYPPKVVFVESSGSICEHNKRRDVCVPCGGSSICEHQTVRRKCVKCELQKILDSGMIVPYDVMYEAHDDNLGARPVIFLQ